MAFSTVNSWSILFGMSSSNLNGRKIAAWEYRPPVARAMANDSQPRPRDRTISPARITSCLTKGAQVRSSAAEMRVNRFEDGFGVAARDAEEAVIAPTPAVCDCPRRQPD